MLKKFVNLKGITELNKNL